MTANQPDVYKRQFQRMSWADAMKYYGSDKPDLRFGMKFVELMDIMKGHGFSVFDNAAYVGGICAEGAATYTRKQLDALTDFVKKPQIGAKGMVYALSLIHILICLHRLNPMPELDVLVVKKGTKILSRTSGKIPSPMFLLYFFLR